jgi:hypothetical protein
VFAVVSRPIERREHNGAGIERHEFEHYEIVALAPHEVMSASQNSATTSAIVVTAASSRPRVQSRRSEEL